MTERIPGWLARVLFPRLSEMAGDIKAIDARIEGLDSKVGEMDKRRSSNDARLEDKVDSPDKETRHYPAPRGAGDQDERTSAQAIRRHGVAG